MIDTLRVLVDTALSSHWLLAVIVVLAVADAMLPVVPAEALIIGAGVAAAAGEQHLLAVIAAAAAGAVVGECATYVVGRGGGAALRRRLPAGSRQAALADRVDGLLATRGGLILLTARYVPGGRTVAGLAAGAAQYPAARFGAFTVLGATMSAAYVTLLGFFGGTAFAHDTIAALLFSLGVGLAITLVVGASRRVAQPAS